MTIIITRPLLITTIIQYYCC